ncbi:pentapeptide repeat-containing protein [Oceanidesulfovibrio marinus]|nr:pentapeptide repeat-containing protein [Oceanidesulfovibrio marinus]
MTESFRKRLFRKIDKACYRPVCAIRSRRFSILCKILLVVAFLVVWDFVAHQEGVVRTWVSHAWNELLSLMGDGGTPAPPFEIAKGLGLLVAAFLGLGFTAWRAFAYDRQTVVKEQGHLTDRFNKAAEQLGSEHVTVRIAAINALWRIGVDSKSQDDKRAVLDVLCGFVREYRPESVAQSAQMQKKRLARVLLKRKHTVSPPKRKATQQVCPPDVQTVLDFLGKRMDALRFKPWRMNYVVDLSGAYLAGCNLEGRSLAGVNLRGTDLRQAQAAKVDLRDANLHNASLDDADLWEAHLDGANLRETYLVGAKLWGAHLKEAKLWDAHLDGAFLRFVHLDGAILAGAHLNGANLEGAHLDKAILFGAHLNGVALSGATFKDVTHLTQAQLDAACWDGADAPMLPPGFTCPSNYYRQDFLQGKLIPIDPPDTIAPCPAEEPDE